MSLRLCDGCGRPADDRHLRERIARLEMATRFRPIHVQVLLLDVAPPARAEDYFYRPTKEPPLRSTDARERFADLMEACGIGRSGGEEEALGEFQRRGYFLAEGLECPLEAGEAPVPTEGSDVALSLLDRRLPTLIQRIRFSYRPKFILPVNGECRRWLDGLRAAGLGPLLLLQNSALSDWPGPADQARRAEFREALAALLRRAVAQSRGA